MARTGGWGRGRRYRDMQRAIDGVPPLSGRDVITVLVALGGVGGLIVLLRVATPLSDGSAALAAILVAIAVAVWWSRRRRRRAAGDGT